MFHGWVDTTLRWLAFFHFIYVSTSSPTYHVKARGCWNQKRGEKPNPSNQGLYRVQDPLSPSSSKETIREPKPARGNWPHRSVNDPLAAVREAETMNIERTCFSSLTYSNRKNISFAFIWTFSLFLFQITEYWYEFALVMVFLHVHYCIKQWFWSMCLTSSICIA